MRTTHAKRITHIAVALAMGFLASTVIAEKPDNVSVAEFKKHFARVDMAETMRVTKFVGIEGGKAVLSVREMSLLNSNKWSTRNLAINLADLDAETRAKVEKMAKETQKPAATQHEEENAKDSAGAVDDIAYFEKRYAIKLDGVRPMAEYDDPDKFYSAIATKLGIPALAGEAAAKELGWGPDTQLSPPGAIVKRGPGGPWEVMVFRFPLTKRGGGDHWEIRPPVTKDGKKPDPAALASGMISVLVRIDDDKKVLSIEKQDHKNGGDAAAPKAKGGEAARIVAVSVRLGLTGELRSSLRDAHFLQGQSDKGTPAGFAALTVAPEDLSNWRSKFAAGPVDRFKDGKPRPFVGPQPGQSWWVSKEDFTKLDFYGTPNRWIGIAADGRIFIYEVDAR